MHARLQLRYRVSEPCFQAPHRVLHLHGLQHDERRARLHRRPILHQHLLSSQVGTVPGTSAHHMQFQRLSRKTQQMHLQLLRSDPDILQKPSLARSHASRRIVRGHKHTHQSLPARLDNAARHGCRHGASACRGGPLARPHARHRRSKLVRLAAHPHLQHLRRRQGLTRLPLC